MDRGALILYELSKCMRSMQDDLSISSALFGECLGISQQSASRYLCEIEKKGYIKRARGPGGQIISITPRGISLLQDIYVNLGSFFSETQNSFVLEGCISSGLGEGAYYVKEYSDILERYIGFIPFFGTLNIKLKRPCLRLERLSSGIIRGFEKDDRTFGDVKYIRAMLVGEDWEENVHILIPQRTHHVDSIELVSKHKLRERFDLSDGIPVKIRIEDLSEV